MVDDNSIMFSPGYYPTKHQQLMIVYCVATSYSYVFFLIACGPFTTDAAMHGCTGTIGLDGSNHVDLPHVTSNQSHDVTHIRQITRYMMSLSLKLC